MKNVKAVFLATSKEAKEIFMPFYRKLISLGCDVMVYNSGPVCEEIKDRNVVITADREFDKEAIESFGIGVVCLCKSTDVDMGVCAIKRESVKGGA